MCTKKESMIILATSNLKYSEVTNMYVVLANGSRKVHGWAGKAQERREPLFWVTEEEWKGSGSQCVGLCIGMDRS